LTELFLSRLRRIGSSLNAVATLMEESALAAAKRADAVRRSGIPRQPLHGIPYAAKDLLDTKGVATTWGSPQFKDRIPSADATAIARLAEAKRLHLRPLGVSQNESVHPQLESQPGPDENPKSQQTLALQLLFLKASESMGNHDSEVVGACSVD